YGAGPGAAAGAAASRRPPALLLAERVVVALLLHPIEQPRDADDQRERDEQGGEAAPGGPGETEQAEEDEPAPTGGDDAAAEDEPELEARALELGVVAHVRHDPDRRVGAHRLRWVKTVSGNWPVCVKQPSGRFAKIGGLGRAGAEGARRRRKWTWPAWGEAPLSPRPTGLPCFGRDDESRAGTGAQGSHR